MFTEKILCLGNNDQKTHDTVSVLASRDKTINHGLISDPNFIPTTHGYYHTTVIDLVPADIINLSSFFDEIVILDQPLDQWSHTTVYLATYEVTKHLEELGRKVGYQNEDIFYDRRYFQNLLETNKSFCIYPFMHLLAFDGNTHVCGRGRATSIKPLRQIVNWKKDTDYQTIRQKMLAGDLVPEHCSYCYGIEKNGGKGARYHETLEWTAKLGIKTVEDLETIQDPVYYEIRPSNKCNLMCRTCVPRDSHLIDQEFKDINLEHPTHKIWPVHQEHSNFDIINLNSIKRLYVAGGEPTVMPELYDFLRRSIDNGTTDFEFYINTNAQKISQKLLDLLRNFPNIGITVSLDGVGKVNDYIRWRSDFQTVVDNTHRFLDNGQSVGFIDVVSIYNITTLGDLLEFQDREFPNSQVMLQFDQFPGDLQSPYNHPNVKMAMESLDKCKKTKAYYNYARGTKSIIDVLYEHYSSNPQCDWKKLKKFFEFNDSLDRSRNSRLEDYIPELAEIQKKIQKYG